jgi:uncharacterized DUF497 family protein
MQYTIEWDPDKARDNAAKHGVTFERAAEVLLDPLAMTIYDDSHSTQGDDRWITMGHVGDELIVVVHTFDEASSEEARVRIISARLATKRERAQYEEGS